MCSVPIRDTHGQWRSARPVQETREGTNPRLAPSTSAQPGRNEPLRSHDRAHSEALDIDKRLARLDKRVKTLLSDLKKWRRASDEHWKAYKAEEKPRMDQIEKLVAEITEGTKQLLKTSNAHAPAARAHRPKEKKETPAS